MVKVTAIAPGTAKITVTTKSGNKTANCIVTVKEVSQNLSPERAAIIKRAEEMAEYKWVAKSTFRTWQGSNGKYNVLPDWSTQFVKGETYTGIPYTMHPNQTL